MLPHGGHGPITGGELALLSRWQPGQKAGRPEMQAVPVLMRDMRGLVGGGGAGLRTSGPVGAVLRTRWPGSQREGDRTLN